MEIKAAHWLNYYSDWLQNNPPENILVLHFENLQQNLKWVLVQQKFIKFMKKQILPNSDLIYSLCSGLWLFVLKTYEYIVYEKFRKIRTIKRILDIV